MYLCICMLEWPLNLAGIKLNSILTVEHGGCQWVFYRRLEDTFGRLEDMLVRFAYVCGGQLH